MIWIDVVKACFQVTSRRNCKHVVSMWFSWLTGLPPPDDLFGKQSPCITQTGFNGYLFVWPRNFTQITACSFLRRPCLSTRTTQVLFWHGWWCLEAGGGIEKKTDPSQSWQGFFSPSPSHFWLIVCVLFVWLFLRCWRERTSTHTG